MDFESYIGKERQLLTRIERERAELNSHEPGAARGNFELAADEIKLLQAGDYVAEAARKAADAIAELDARMAQLRQAEAEVGAVNEAFLKRVAEWEAKFDARYSEAMALNAELAGRIEKEQRTLVEIGERAEESLRQIGGRTEQNLRDISERAESGIRTMGGITEANLKDLGRTSVADVERLVSAVKAAQAEFEASVSEKLEQDKQTLEKIRFMISAMNEIIKT